MAIRLISVKCPDCGATLSIEENRGQAFCTYCGARIIVHNENEFIYRHIDEAEIKEAETDRIIRLKQMEYAEKKRIEAEKTKALKIKLSLILGTVGIIMLVIGYMAGHASGDSNSSYYFIAMIGFFPFMGAAYIWIFSKNKDDYNEIAFEDKAIIPSSISGYKKKSYSVVEAMFISAGFTNVRCIALNDLTVGLLKKPGMVESITINGHIITSGGEKYPRDAAVVITYHSLNR